MFSKGWEVQLPALLHIILILILYGSLMQNYLLKRRKRASQLWPCSTLHADSPLKREISRAGRPTGRMGQSTGGLQERCCNMRAGIFESE